MPLQMRTLVIPALHREASALAGEYHSNLIRDIFHNLCAVMPVTEDDDIYSLIRQIIGEDSSSATTQFLELAIYFLSNKLFDKYTDEYWKLNDELLRWFKIGNHHRLLRGILSSRTPTIDALAEGLFASALRAEDLALSRIFLESGLKPDIELSFFEYTTENRYGVIFRGTPLKVATQRSNISLLKLLFEFHANADRASGFTNVLVWAVEAGSVEVTRLLISEGAFVNTVPGPGPTLLQAALERGNVEIVRLLLDAGADVNPSGIYEPRAIQSKDGIETRRLLQLGADVNAPAGEYDGSTALQAAAKNGDLPLCYTLVQAGADVNAAPAAPGDAAALKGHMDIVKYLLDRDADVNWPPADNGGLTSLQAAVRSGCTELVEFLITQGADVNAPAAIQWGVTALQEAVRTNSKPLVDLLLEARANANDKPTTSYGLSSLQYAAEIGEDDLVETLLRYGASVNGPVAHRMGQTALQAAVGNGHFTTVRLLLAKGAHVNHPGSIIESFGTALQIAARKGYVRIAKVLIDARANINAPGTRKREGGYYSGTALELAANHGRIDMLKLLLNAGADITTGAGRRQLGNALERATRSGHDAVAKFLECHQVSKEDMGIADGSVEAGVFQIMEE
ncbi:multiple ankyrin repeats single kh domain protein [Rutstroemia sp. NJR-2017a BBW]|nr:multiple ankyrin repeats single kh domain protein [Rutstroemia sp. NJR-2017a BBW]